MTSDVSALSSPERAKRAVVRPLCRGYASVVAVMQVALLVAIYNRVGSTGFFPYVVVGLTLLGTLLLVFNQPVGRPVFIPAALLQVAVMGFTAFIGLMALFAAWFQQSGAAAQQAVAYTFVSGGTAVLLLIGLPLVATSRREE